MTERIDHVQSFQRYISRNEAFLSAPECELDEYSKMMELTFGCLPPADYLTFLRNFPGGGAVSPSPQVVVSRQILSLDQSTIDLSSFWGMRDGHGDIIYETEIWRRNPECASWAKDYISFGIAACGFPFFLKISGQNVGQVVAFDMWEALSSSEPAENHLIYIENNFADFISKLTE
jgi:hypothetical protein